MMTDNVNFLSAVQAVPLTMGVIMLFAFGTEISLPKVDSTITDFLKVAPSWSFWDGERFDCGVGLHVMVQMRLLERHAQLS